MDYLELRVHGVHGTSPGTMLGVSDGEVAQVAGDGLTGLYRTTSGAVPLRTLDIQGPARKPADRVAVEAYSWGALTSGVKGLFGWLRRVGWLLLLPFALANLAYWARLEVGNTGPRARWGAVATRVAGLALTVFMVLTPCVIAIDILGWQCFRDATDQCAHVPSQLSFLEDWSPTQRLLGTSLVPLLVVAILGFLSRQTMTAYEEVRPRYATEFAVRQTDADTRVPVLRRPFLWSAADRTRRLQRLHLSAGIATVVLFVSAQVLARTWDEDVRIGLVPTVLAGLVLAACTLLVALEHDQDLESGDGTPSTGPLRILRDGRLAGWLLVATAVVFVAQAWRLYAFDATFSTAGDYSGNNVWFITMFLVLTALHLFVFFVERIRLTGIGIVVVLVGEVVSVGLGWVLTEHWSLLTAALVVAGLWFVVLLGWHWTRPDEGARAWRGAGPSVLLAAAAWVALLFTSSAVIGAADYLNGPDSSVGDLSTATATRDQVTRSGYLADGPVTLSRARYSVEGDRLVVHSGTITADTFTGTSGLREQRVGKTRITARTTLELPEGTVRLERSCFVVTGGDAFVCRLRSGAVVTDGVLRPTIRSVVLAPRAAPGEKAMITLSPRTEYLTTLVVPQVLVWTPLAQLLWLAVVIVALIGCVIRFGLGAGRQVAAALPLNEAVPPPDGRIPRRDRPACRSKRRTAAFGHRAERLLDVIGTITGPIAVGLIICSFTGRAPWEQWAWTDGAADLAMYVTMAAAAGLVLLGSQLRRSESTRKAVGVIWDLTTFWPRAAHPLAPPCYAERVVPELDVRTRWALNSHPTNQVILSGHSQGSLIVAAMASRLDDISLRRVWLITYGSQIRALYGRVFPGVFGADAVGYLPTTGPATLADGYPDVRYGTGTPPCALEPESLRARLAEAGSSWVNLFRRSDPLGYRVFSDNDSDLDRPVVEVPAAEAGDPGPLVATHSGYQQSREYRAVICDWTGERLFDVDQDEHRVVNAPPLPRT